MERTASSSSLASSTGNPTELKTETSLIDFDADPEPLSTAPGPQPQQIVPPPTVAQPPQSSNDNWASFDSSPVIKSTQPSTTSSNLLDMLSEISVPAPGNNPAVATTPPSTFNAFGDSGYGGQWQNVVSHQNPVPATGIQLPTTSLNQVGGGYLQKNRFILFKRLLWTVFLGRCGKMGGWVSGQHGTL
ncbi:putative ADP-ribosylation factor GTPase-activating protein AGD14 [Helianthus annuus]|nr:putative ADP-ribosylation factor GTPase-activating protein AGD14 [Helianthus annuus]KAJ0709970.1 putative ADP-ribosylation factor GTPase-activating protein AGD14 [Helianthus annuus]